MPTIRVAGRPEATRPSCLYPAGTSLSYSTESGELLQIVNLMIDYRPVECPKW